MKFTIHNIGFSGGKPIFPKAASTAKKKKVEVKRAEHKSPKKNCILEKNEQLSSPPVSAKWRFRSRSLSPVVGGKNRFRRVKPAGYGLCFPYKASARHLQVQQVPFQPRGWLSEVREITEESNLEFVERRSRTKLVGVVTKGECDENALCPLRLVCDASGFYKVEVFSIVKEQGLFKSRESIKETIVKLFGSNSAYTVCRGLTGYPEHGEQLGYQPKNLRHWGIPMKRVDSVKCELLHKPKNRKRRPGDLLFDVCGPCKKLHRSLAASLRRKTESSCKSRTSPSSTCNWKVLSPKSNKKRRFAVSKSKRKVERKLRRLKSSQCTLSDKQDLEMTKIVNIIEKDFPTDLEGTVLKVTNS